MSTYAPGAAKRGLTRPIPDRIKEAREARGFTLESFAEALDVSKQAVAQFEIGQTSPSGEVMGKIIALTAQPPSFFVTPRERPGIAGTPFWRSLKRMEAHHPRRIARRLQWARDITSYIERFIDLPEVCLPSIEFDATLDDEEQIERAAEALRDCWSLGRGPIKNLVSLLEANGILLFRERVDCADMDAVSLWQGGRPFILLSAENNSGPRELYNIAHELAHVLLHSDVELSLKNLDLVEKQANRFAGAFLMPRESFSQEVLGTSIGYFKSLKGRWGVAIAAMAYRSKELQIINGNQHSYIMRQMNALRIRKSEPLDDIVPIVSPSILSESLKMLTGHGVQSKEQIESGLCINLADVESICGLDRGVLDMRVVSFMPRPREAK